MLNNHQRECLGGPVAYGTNFQLRPGRQSERSSTQLHGSIRWCTKDPTPPQEK
ncbi:hypothetical protein K443DRAFT_293961 [Laccaria amethystina LaAM-08-1]|uniref:Uncharacterized protein n=1 Tax=Laccaria amethystina LaAM-08-1 TaxID=1095629 RepID=A0A0C9X4F5_9AGAR|nr:hypothetical protein K443DRAFT_293961 [Laccaria amethystina LaAM-08-1]